MMALWLACSPIPRVPEPADEDSGEPPIGLQEDTSPPAAPEICINELMPDNVIAAVQEDGSSPDWVELYNPTPREISLDGWSLTDDPEDPWKSRLDGLAVPSRGFLLLWADGETSAGPRHLGFSLSAEGGQIGLVTAEGGGSLVSYGPIAQDFSAARSRDCCLDEGCFVFVWMGTPGSTNGA